MLVLIGLALVVIGFVLRMNPLLVVTVSGLVTGAVGGLTPLQMLDIVGTAFADSRPVMILLLALPMVGLVERMGLQAHVRRTVGRLASLTPGRILLGYLALRQVTAAAGLLTVLGVAQTVRPVLYPMVEAAAERRAGPLTEEVRDRLKGSSVGVETVGMFFAEDVFVAVGSVLLITSFVDANYGLQLEPLDLAVWAIPSAVVAFAVHGFRALRTDRMLRRRAAAPAPDAVP
ncbi:DUF969 family protein [Pseudonocardia sp. NPDC046786]|uniref:5-oxoproline transporter, DUF969 family subunit n=1 Tax=Pseudonocardia sp. NPDC046786 TaxID=3155471 RepID=UPI0033F46711